MKFLYFVLSVLLFYIFLDYCVGEFIINHKIPMTEVEGVAQECGLTHTLESGGGFKPIDVNITATPSCFVCPETDASFSLNGETLMDAPPDVVIDSTKASIFNWSAVSLKLQFVNVITCIDRVGFTHTTRFFSLTPGPLTLKDNLSYYFEGGNNTNVQCVNFNARREYNVRKEIWMNSAGEVVGNGGTLNLSATRDNAGIYTCTVPDVPLIRPVMFEVVIYSPGPLILKDNLSYYIEGGNNTNVQCVNFNARPEYNVEREIWMNSAGEVVGNGGTLNLSATRDNAGIYTCTDPDVPLILPVMFEVVIYSLASDEKEYSSSSTILTSTVVNSTGNTGMSNFPDATVVIIVATLLSIIVVSTVLVAILLFLIFRKKIKKEGVSKTQLSDNIILEHYSPDVDVRNQQSFDQLHLTDEETIQGYETDLYATVDEDMKKRSPDVVNFDNDKDEKNNNAKCPDISELYAVVDKNRSQQADKEISDIYSVVDKSKRKDKVDDKLPDLYATVDKTKKESKVNDNAELSDMYATVDKTKKNNQVNDTELSEMYATVDKTKKKSKANDNVEISN